jgi:hypothetical protein
MSFQSISAGCGDTNWSASAQTVQDLDADSTGNTVYATGTVTTRRLGVITGTQTLDNRGYSVVNGNIILRPPFYTIADSKKCLNQLLLALANIGKQSG